MTPRLLRLIAGFLATFVLLSYTPAISGLVRGAAGPPVSSGRATSGSPPQRC